MITPAMLVLASEGLLEPEVLSGAAANCWLIPLFPLLACLIIAFVTRPWGKLSAGLSILAMGGSLVTALGVFSQRLAHLEAPPMEASYPWVSVLEGRLGIIEMGLLVDNLSATMLAMVCFIALLIQIYSFSYIDTEIHHFPTQDESSMSRFYVYLSLFAFSMLGLVLSNNLLQIYIFWELVGVCSYFLIGFWYFKKSAADACKKAFIVTKFADLGFLIGILMVGVGSGSFNFLQLMHPGALAAGIMFSNALALALVFCGAIGKSAQFPLQIWLPDAMEGPTPVSALIHAATMVAAGIFLVARLFDIFAATPGAATFVATIGTITAFVAASIAVTQNDIKRVLAYSTVSQLGFMLAALGCGALTAGVFHLLTHAFFKALLFLGSGAVIVACHNNDMWTMGGLKKKLPFTHFAFAMGCLALSGIPPFAGFWSKDEVVAGTQNHPVIMVVLLISAFLTAFYVTRMYCIAFNGDYRGAEHAPEFAGPIPPANLPAPMQPSRDVFETVPDWTEEKALEAGPDLPPACLGAHMEHVSHDHHEPHEVSPVMYGPLLILSVFAIGLGFIGVPHEMGGSNWFHSVIHSQQAHPVPFSGLLMGISVLVAGGGVLWGWLLFGNDPAAGEAKLRKMLGPVWTFLAQKWYMDHLWAWLVSNTMFLAARVTAWLDDEVVDGSVRGVAWGTGLLGEKLRYEHSGLVQQYILMLLCSGLILLAVVAFAEPDFVLSPARMLNLDFGGLR
ncbi:MAG: NADH-quinone oxidoreductase subunit L [Vulcanimicrobiota bacterium]